MPQFNLPFIVDPKTKEPSVSVSILVVAFVTALVAAGLEMSGKTTTSSISLELFYAASALYMGRKWTSKSGTLESTTEGK